MEGAGSTNRRTDNRSTRNSFFREKRGAFETSSLFFRKNFRWCDLLLKNTWTVEFCIAKLRPNHVLDNFGEDSMMLSRHPLLYNTTMPDFPEHHSPGNWRPIIRETDSDSSSVSSSSENLSPKGAKLEEERTSSKASRNVSPTFGDTHAHDANRSTTFLDRELFVKDLPGWCRNHGKGGVYAHDTIHPAIRERIPTQCQGLSMMQPRNWERLHIFAILMCKILVLYASSV